MMGPENVDDPAASDDRHYILSAEMISHTPQTVKDSFITPTRYYSIAPVQSSPGFCRTISISLTLSLHHYLYTIVDITLDVTRISHRQISAYQQWIDKDCNVQINIVLVLFLLGGVAGERKLEILFITNLQNI